MTDSDVSETTVTESSVADADSTEVVDTSEDDGTVSDDFMPVEIRGQDLSATVIEERR